MLVALPVVLSLVVVVVVVMVLRKSGAFGPSKAQRALAQQLVTSGEKARAMVLSVQPTGTVVNNVNIQCVLTFQIQPLRGGQPFQGQKTSLISQAALPRIGDVWPCWFDPRDPTQFAVGQPTAITPEQIALYHEFGIPHPCDMQQQGFGQQPGFAGQQPGYPQPGYPPQSGPGAQGFQQPPPAYGP